MTEELRSVDNHALAVHARQIHRQKDRDFKFILDVCSWFNIAIAFTVLQIMFFVAFAVTAPPEGHDLEDWLALIRGLRTMAVLFYELPFVFRKTQWISICHRYRLPSHTTEFGSIMGLVQQLILIGTIEPQLIHLWHAHQLEEPLLGQSTGILLTAFVIVTAVIAMRKLVVRIVLLTNLEAYLRWKQRGSTQANPRDAALRHD